MTSSQSYRSPTAEAATTIFMVSSQETAEFVSVETVWLRLSPGRRRLRFSFQINDVKDPTGLPAPLFFAGGRRRRLSSGRPLSCQSILSVFFGRPGHPGIWPIKSLGAAEGLPSCVRSDSTEARENTDPGEKIKGCFQRSTSISFRPRPGRRRLLSGRPRGCQSVLSNPETAIRIRSERRFR